MESDGGKLKLNRLILMLRWPVIAVIGIWYLIVELLEHPGALVRWDATFLSEVIVLETLLITVGVAIGWLVKTIREKTSTLRILEAKNDLSQRLTAASDWDQMTTLLVEYPRTILPLKAASLHTYSTQTEQFELTAYWSTEPPDHGFSSRVPAPHRCSQCAFTQPFKLRSIELLCNIKEDLNIENDFCLPLSYGDAMRAMLQLRLPPDTKPSAEQVEMLNNLGPEMAISLRAAQENHIREQLAAENAAEATRQEITRDMHDTLAQNLAYMQLKLDQIMHQDEQLQVGKFNKDLHKLRDVADESYELVRSTLGALHPNNTRRLAEILSQHAYTFADRVDFDMKFTQEGQPQPLDSMVIHHVYQLYREALSNVDRHAEAKLVETSLMWMEQGFVLTVKDDGQGFDDQPVDEGDHYGLNFMGERVDELNGKFSIDTQPGSGTTITITVPYAPADELTTASNLI